MDVQPPELKVLAYILRSGLSGSELLVFRHRDHPEAGIQVPGGKVEPGESVIAGLHREVLEEAGIVLTGTARQIAAYEDARYNVRRCVFAAEVDEPRDSWSHAVAGQGEDRGLVFEYYWVPVAAAAAILGWQGEFVHLLDC